MAGLGSFFLEIGVDSAALQRGLNNAETRLTAFGQRAEKIGTSLSLAISAPLALVGKNALQTSAQFESLEMSFGTMLRSMENGKTLMKDLQKYNLATSFQFEEVAGAGKSLLAFGFAQQQIIPQMKMIGDISAGVGINIKDLAEIYGKARVQGRLFSEDINQLTGRGIPIIAELAKQFGVSEQAIKKMTEDGKIGFANLEKAFVSMTSQGGQFFNMTANQSTTLSGLYSNLQDSVTMNLRTIGDSIVKNLDLKTVIPQASQYLTDLADKFSKLSPEAQKAILVIGGAAVVLPPLLALAGTVLPAIATGFTALISPAGLAATSLVAAAGLIVSNWDKVSDSIFRAKTNARNALLAIGMTFADIQSGIDSKGANEMRGKLLKAYYESAPEDKQASRFREQALKNYDANRRLMYRKGKAQSVTDTESLGKYYEQKDNLPTPPPPPSGLNLSTDAEIEKAKRIAEETKKIRLGLINDTQNAEIAVITDRYAREKAEAKKSYNDDVKAKMDSIQGKKGLEDEYIRFVTARYKKLQFDLAKISNDEQANLEKMLASRKGIKNNWVDVVKEYFDRTTPENDKAPAIDKRMDSRLKGILASGARAIQSESNRSSVGKVLGMDIDVNKWESDSATYIDAAKGIVDANYTIKNSFKELGIELATQMSFIVGEMITGTAKMKDLSSMITNVVAQELAKIAKTNIIAGFSTLLATGNPLRLLGGIAAGIGSGVLTGINQGRASNQTQRISSQPSYSVTRGSNIYTANKQYETIRSF